MRRRTWKTLKWVQRPKAVTWIPLDCPCGYEAEVQCGVLSGGAVIATCGMAHIFDPPSFAPPSNWLPNEIKCRKCGRIYTDQEG